MTSHNPFINWHQDTGSIPATHSPTLGALPFYQPPSQPSLLVFELVGQPDVLNCCMLDRDRRAYPIVIPDPSNSRATIVQGMGKERIAAVEWGASPIVSIRGGILPRQPVYQWLTLTPDGRQRLMDVRGTQYIWSPQRDILTLTKPSTSAICARVVVSQAGARIEIDSHHLHQGFLESVIVATILLCCGRALD
ncbi:hypothetical protein DL96DRAFT_1714579 [Flagelloscypha sp. PMI_526]|nr:hypothetical protein DL96DRAFT_1714579 [Flagelloscypha sp. PMI_526]